MTHAPALDVERAFHAFGRTTVLDAVSFSGQYGRWTSIIGPNGAGKSTLLRLLVGLIPSLDTIRIEGCPLESLPPKARAKKIAYVPQFSELSADFSVAQVVAQGRYAHGHHPADETRRVAAALETVGASHLRDRSFLHLSGGERRLVTLARAVCSDARILVLDEPTSSLDIAHRLDICGLLRRLASAGYCVVCVLHELDDALEHSDDCVLLDAGSLVASGAVDRVANAANLARVYGVEMRPGQRPGFRRLERGI